MYKEALADADACIKLRPDWSKGYSRKGLALFHLDKYDEAIEIYKKGLAIEPANEQMKEGLKECETAKTRPKKNPMGELFGESMWAKLATNPTTREYLKD